MPLSDFIIVDEVAGCWALAPLPDPLAVSVDAVSHAPRRATAARTLKILIRMFISPLTGNLLNPKSRIHRVESRQAISVHMERRRKLGTRFGARIPFVIKSLSGNSKRFFVKAVESQRYYDRMTGL
jgi:hypothetical protein